MPTPNVRPGPPDHFFWMGLLSLLALALGHSLWATSLDGFTIDEPYHIAAGGRIPIGINTVVNRESLGRLTGSIASSLSCRLSKGKL